MTTNNILCLCVFKSQEAFHCFAFYLMDLFVYASYHRYRIILCISVFAFFSFSLFLSPCPSMLWFYTIHSLKPLYFNLFHTHPIAFLNNSCNSNCDCNKTHKVTKSHIHSWHVNITSYCTFESISMIIDTATRQLSENRKIDQQ